MAEPSPTPPVSTFVIRFWREWSGTEGRWRGRIEHVQSGAAASFLGFEALPDLIRRLGEMPDDPVLPQGGVGLHPGSGPGDPA